jgi:hypothetical protein
MTRTLKTQRRRTLTRWTALLQQRFPTFSRPQAFGLALWSIGIVLAKSASLHAVVLALVCWLCFHPLNLRKRLQEWYLEAQAKKGHGTAGRGHQRRDWNPRTTAPYLLRWIVDQWPNRQLVLALDPTNFADRFTVLNISVLYRGCAVPVIWTVVQGGQPEAWEPHWERMLRALAPAVPAGWQVLVLTDRGLYSPSLFACLKRLHWHPFLRIRAQGFYCREGSSKWLNLEDLQPPEGQTEAFAAEVFKNAPGRLECTLVAYHGAGHAEPWLIVTDLSPQLAQASWYGLRGWIEQGYKRLKGEGWKLPRTRITTCARLERLWLAVAVATLWVLEVGGEAEVAECHERQQAREPGPKTVGADTPELPDLEVAQPQPGPSQASPEPPTVGVGRQWSVFGLGWQLLRNALAVGLLVLGSWQPEPWPDHPAQGLPATPATDATKAEQANQPARPPPTAASATRIHESDSG